MPDALPQRSTADDQLRYDLEERCVYLDAGRPQARCILAHDHDGDHFYDLEEVGR